MMTNEELNRRIAKLRGECSHRYVLTKESDFPGEDAHIWTCEICKHEEFTFGRWNEKPEENGAEPYSTDMNAAMKLFADLEERYDQVMLAGGKKAGGKNMCILANINAEGIQRVGDTPAEAIANAWLAVFDKDGSE
jgi:hypothetical protein